MPGQHQQATLANGHPLESWLSQVWFFDFASSSWTPFPDCGFPYWDSFYCLYVKNSNGDLGSSKLFF